MICIDFSGEYIDIVVAQGTKKRVTVESNVTLKAPADIFLANGDIDFNVLEECLRPVLARISDKRVAMSFSCLPTVYSVLNLHKEKNRQQQRIAVESQVFANISPDEYYVDFFETVDKAPADDKQTYVSYAMSKRVADESFEMIRRLDKSPIALVPSQYAAENFISTYFENETVALAKLGDSSIALHLLNPPDNMITRDVVVDSAAGSLDVVASIGGSVSAQTLFIQNIEKLNSYQNIKFPGKPIDKVCVFGPKADSSLVSLIGSTVGLKCELLSDVAAEFAKGCAVYTLGAMLSLGTNEINFFNKNKIAKAATKKTKTKANKFIWVASALIILNVLATVGIVVFDIRSQNAVDDRKAELTSPETLALIEEYGSLREDLVSMLKGTIALEALSVELELAGEFNREILFDSVDESPDGVEVTSASYSDKTYSFICNGQNEQQAADYVEALTNRGLFSFVEYYGYSESGNEVSFTVVGKL